MDKNSGLRERSHLLDAGPELMVPQEVTTASVLRRESEQERDPR